MTSLQVVQTLTAGVDNIRGSVPEGVTLCNGRGIHDTSTAELALTLILASLRGIPGFVRAQDRHEWEFGWRPALADRRVLLVGYGAIGQAVEARLAAVRGRGRPGRPLRPRRRPRHRGAARPAARRRRRRPARAAHRRHPRAWSTPGSWPG